MTMSDLYYTNTLSLIVVELSHRNNSLRVDVSPPLTLYYDSKLTSLFLLLNPECREASNTSVIVLGYILPVLETTSYPIRGKRACHSTIGAFQKSDKF